MPFWQAHGEKMKKLLCLILTLIFLVSICSCTAKYGGENNHTVGEYRTTMVFHEDFKILQITDLHLGIESDLAKQLEVLKNSINEAKPDLIILTGDNFMYANKSIVNLLVETLNEECKALTAQKETLTKFAITFGNHDGQGDYPRYYINEVIASYTTTDGNEISDGKYASYVDFEDDKLYGLANYYIDLVDKENSDDVKYRIHIIDSNTYKNNGIKYKYDVIHKEQLLHAQNIYQNATDDKDYIGLAFFHIPFEEYGEAYEQFLQNGEGQGIYNEGVLSPYENNGSYEMLRKANICAFFVGHDHINYGDFLYNDKNSNKSILSYGVKATNQLYHNTEMIGYKVINLKDVAESEFVSYDYIKENFENITTGYAQYE